MSDETKKPLADRRNFIKLAGASAATAGAAVVSAGAIAAAPVVKPADDAMYRETDHVKRYYELAR
jgi:hypothetical protein